MIEFVLMFYHHIVKYYVEIEYYWHTVSSKFFILYHCLINLIRLVIKFYCFMYSMYWLHKISHQQDDMFPHRIFIATI